jgi:heme exporter protein B
MRTAGGFASFSRKVWAVGAKDLRAEFRTREVFLTMAAFSVLAVIVFGLAFDLRVPDSEMVVPGVLWVVVLYTGVLGLNRSFGAEMDHGTLAGLLLAPMDRSAIYFGKFLAGMVLMFSMELLVLPVILVIFDVNLFHPVVLFGLFLGTVGYVGVGTLFAAMTSNSRARESMLPILLLPVMVPIFMAGVGLTAKIVDGGTIADASRWLWMIAGYDLVFITIAYLVFDMIWEEA